MSAGQLKATPGPWEASLEAARFVIQHTPEHGMGKRAIACTAGAEPANPYNAYLIAAAPELFEALYAMIGRVEHASNQFHNSQQWHEEDAPDGSGTMWDWVFAPAHAALRKARGETQ